jgi:thiamine biosynthesis lipoprotein
VTSAARWLRRAAAALSAAALAVGAGGAAADEGACPPVALERARPAMGTLVTIQVRGCAGADLETPVRGAFAEVARLEAILSEWRPDSPVSAVNAAAGRGPVPAPGELIEVLAASAKVSGATRGAFDVTWAALRDVWRFDPQPPRLPTPEEVRARRALIDYRDVAVDLQARTVALRRAGMQLGLGGVAKGYVAEKAADFLVAHGVANALVAASGDIAARGRNGGRPWTVAVQDPRRRAGVLGTVELHDESISTSGDYEKFFVVGGRRYHHILDPATGYPATRSRSVTVLGRRGAVVDALAAGLFVLGAPQDGPVLAKFPDVSVIHVTAGGKIQVLGAPGRFHLAPRPAQGRGGSRRGRSSRL